MKELLSSSGVKVDYKYSDLTPLNSLAKNLKNENFSNVLECMKILLDYGASPNIPDQREMTPLHNIIKNHKISDNRKYEIVQMFVTLKDIDIDTYREGELREILEKEYPLMELPPRKEVKTITFHNLLNYIRNDQIDIFEQHYRDENLNELSKEEELQLFVASIEFGAFKAFDLILAKGVVDYNQTIKHNNTPIEIAWTYGNWYALEKLLQLPGIKLRSKDYPLSSIVRKLNEDSVQEFCNYWKCFYVLLDSDKIDINAMDFSRSTALHYAVKYRNNKAVKELLKRGACISLENTFNELPLYGMCPAVWEAQLNDCITCSNEEWGDKNFEICINFQNFMTSQQKKLKQLKAVLAPIAFMAKSKEYRYLLQHPVITTILYLKWHKLSLIFYINFLLYLFFTFSIITYIVLEYRVQNSQIIKNIALYGSYLGICYLIARELLQLLLSPLKYFKSFTNYLELLLIIFSFLTCYKWPNKDMDLARNLAVACILLTAYELAVMVGSLPISSISTHMLMLKAVCKSFLKGFLLYSIFVLTFALCFYIKSDNNVDFNDENYFHKFSNPLVAFSKTIVMFTGEFDAGSLKLDSEYNYVLFLSFVFFMTIILFNLINGLAVSDTQAIKDQAELNDIICRTDILYRYEQAAVEQTEKFKYLLRRPQFRVLVKILTKLFPDYTTDVQVSIMPNDGNRIFASKTIRKMSIVIKNVEETCKDNQNVITINDYEVVTDNDDDDDVNDVTKNKYLKCWLSCFTYQCSRIDKRTVQQALAILDQKSVQSIEERLDLMDEKLNKIINSLNLTDDKVIECK